MPVYVYDCCGSQVNTYDDCDNCPECGKKDAYDFGATISSSIDSRHGQVYSVIGERNYYDEGAGRYFHTSKERKAWLRQNDYHPAKNASMAETWW